MDAKLLNSILRGEDDPRVLDCSYNVVSVSFPEIKWPSDTVVKVVGASGIKLRDGIAEDVPIYKIYLLGFIFFGSFFKFNAAAFHYNDYDLQYSCGLFLGAYWASWFDNTALKNCVMPVDWVERNHFGCSVDLFWARLRPRLEVFDGTQI
jgi:hypothetical protein